MHKLPRLPAVLLLAALGAAPAVEPLATRQTAFSIPFRVEGTGSTERPSEVQLYVSTNRGASWKLHSTVPPEQGRFAFKADKDGDYWFLVRTKDHAGQLRPKQPAAPEMQVLVDTTQPALELSAARGQAGEVTIRWHARDPHLQPQNLKLDYQAKGAADLWQSIAIDPRRTQVAAGSCQGEVTLWTRALDEPLVIRGEITDRAGNLAVTQKEVEAVKKTEPPVSDAARPGYPDTGAPAPASKPATAAGETAEPADSHPPATDREAKTSPSSHRGSASGAFFSALGLRWPADTTHKPLARSAAEPPPAAPLVVQRLPTGGGVAHSAESSKQNEPVPVSSPRPPAAPAATESDWVQPPLRDVQRPAPRLPGNPAVAISTVSAAAAAGYQPPPGVRPRMVNSRSFQLDYDLGQPIPGGVRKVELWGTRDGGQNWLSYGADGDVHSPMTVTVEGEGMYGFRILVQNGAGIIEYPPQKGDRPDTWINVDLKRPTCRLTSAQQQRLEQTEQLRIAWEAHDEWLAERPISLSYSQQPIGPWFPIATGLENTGHYPWQLDSRVPDLIYLRL
jgi:hypothetical protein